ncbi:MAG: hypothetical protein ACM3SS_01060 [Rhodospirillaceae bacterium]
MERDKDPDGSVCVLLSGRVSTMARMRATSYHCMAYLARGARSARASIAPWSTRTAVVIRRSCSIAAEHIRACRAQIARELVTRALAAGDTSSDLDGRAAACRNVMWSLVAIAVLGGAALSWKAALVPGAFAICFGALAVVLWDAASELEKREHHGWDTVR